jgi:hypothetical protein
MTTTVMSPSVNSPRLLVIGNPGSNRIGFLNEALTRRGQAPAVLVPWLDLIEERCSLAEMIRPGDFIRIESPGRDADVEAALVGIGRKSERGEIFFPRRWYEGFRKTLTLIETQLKAAPPHHRMNTPEEITLLFDKPASHARFLAAGLPVPRTLGPATSLAELSERMKTLRIRQAFVKLAYGSSAVGALAVRTDGSGKWKAYTTVERDGEKFYSTRQIQTLHDPAEIDARIVALAPEGLHIEEWLPKASLRGKGFDLRALVIGGRLRHVIARLSNSPMTNLHLLNQREDSETVRAHVGESAWEDLTRLAEQTAEVFPQSLHIGLDVMWLSGFCRLALLEANAFGDLLPGTLSKQQTTYEAELDAVGFGTIPC